MIHSRPSLLILLLLALMAACTPMPVPMASTPTLVRTATLAATPTVPLSPVSALTPSPVMTPSPAGTHTATLTVTVSPATATALPTATRPPVEVTFWHSQGQQQHMTLVALADRFNSTHPETRIAIAYQPIYTDLFKTPQSGRTPDMVLAYQSDLEPLARRGTLIPLDDLLRDDKIGLTGGDLTDIFPSFIDRYPRLGNKVYSLGFMRSMQVVYYNAEVLVSAGLSVPQSWDDLNTVCAAVSKPPDRYCYETAPDASSFAAWLFGRGGNLIAPDSKSIAFDQQPGLDSVVWLNDLFRKRQAALAARAFQLPSDFAAGKVVFTLDTVTGLSAYDRAVKSTGKPFAWGIVWPPRTTLEPVVDVYGPGVAIFKTTVDKQRAAFAFIRWLMDPLPNAEWVRATGYLPARASTRAALDEYLKSNASYAQAYGWLRYGRSEPALAAWNPIRSVLADMMSAVATGKAAPDVALKDAAKKANDALAAQ